MSDELSADMVVFSASFGTVLDLCYDNGLHPAKVRPYIVLRHLTIESIFGPQVEDPAITGTLKRFEEIASKW